MAEIQVRVMSFETAAIVNALPDTLTCPKCQHVYTADNGESTEYDRDWVTIMCAMERYVALVLFGTCCGQIVFAFNAPPGEQYVECPCGTPTPHVTLLGFKRRVGV